MARAFSGAGVDQGWADGRALGSADGGVDGPGVLVASSVGVGTGGRVSGGSRGADDDGDGAGEVAAGDPLTAGVGNGDTETAGDAAGGR